MTEQPEGVASGGWRRAAIALSLLLATSCGYLKNRANDLLDVFWVDADYGTTVSVSLRATDFVAVGFGYAKDVQSLFHLHGRHTGEIERSLWAIPLLYQFELYRDSGEMVPVLAGSGDYDSMVQPPPLQSVVFMPGSFFGFMNGRKPYRIARRGLRLADVGVGASFFLGVGVGFSPGELLECFTGIFGLDLSGDDAFRADGRVRDELLEEKLQRKP